MPKASQKSFYKNNPTTTVAAEASGLTNFVGTSNLGKAMELWHEGPPKVDMQQSRDNMQFVSRLMASTQHPISLFNGRLTPYTTAKIGIDIATHPNISLKPQYPSMGESPFSCFHIFEQWFDPKRPICWLFDPHFAINDTKKPMQAFLVVVINNKCISAW